MLTFMNLYYVKYHLLLTFLLKWKTIDVVSSIVSLVCLSFNVTAVSKQVLAI